MSLLSDVEVFLKATGTPPTRLGEAVGDRGFVRELRRGQAVGSARAAHVRRVMAANPKGIIYMAPHHRGEGQSGEQA